MDEALTIVVEQLNDVTRAAGAGTKEMENCEGWSRNIWIIEHCSKRNQHLELAVRLQEGYEGKL